MRWTRFLLILVLAGCMPKIGISEEQRTAWGLEKVVSDFAPDRGEGGKYKIGEQVFFKFNLSQPGYVSLVTIDPDTTTAVLERNIQLPAGSHTFPQKKDVTKAGQAAYQVFPPTGVSRFRLIYTDKPQPTAFVTNPNGEKLTPEELSRRTQAFISSAALKDVAETAMETVK